MTEHSASIFVFFFLGEYSSLILMSAFMSIFFLGGYHCPNIHNILLDPFQYLYYYFSPINISFLLSMFNNINIENWNYLENSSSLSYMEFDSSVFTFFQSLSIFIDKIYGSYIFGFKIVIVVFFFIWIRASFPRLRYDQLMSLCWKELLPLVFGYIIFNISIFSTFDIIPYSNGF